MPIRYEEKQEEKKDKQRDMDNIDFYKHITPKYVREDMVIDEKLEKDLLEILGYVECSDIVFEEWKLSRVIDRNKGILINLYGPPGTGKTMFAHIIANELKRNLLMIDYAQIESKYVGETAKNLEMLFEKAQKAGDILFFDEADALLSKRVSEMSSAADVSVNQTRSVLLRLIDEYTGVCILTTNFLSNYDVAFLRRITKFVKFDLPNEKQREKLWKHYLVEGLPIDFLVCDLVKKYQNISGSEIENAVLSSAIRTAALGKKVIDYEMIIDVIDEIMYAKKENVGLDYEIVEVEK